MTVAASVDDGVQPALVGTGHVVRVRNMNWTCCGVVRQGSRWDQEEAPMELTLSLTTGPANLQQVVRSGAARKGGKPGHTRSPQATAKES